MVKRHTRSGQTEPSHFLSTAEGRGYGRLGPHRYSATGQSRTQEMSCPQVIALFPLEAFRSPEGNEAQSEARSHRHCPPIRIIIVYAPYGASRRSKGRG